MPKTLVVVVLRRRCFAFLARVMWSAASHGHLRGKYHIFKQSGQALLFQFFASLVRSFNPTASALSHSFRSLSSKKTVGSCNLQQNHTHEHQIRLRFSSKCSPTRESCCWRRQQHSWLLERTPRHNQSLTTQPTPEPRLSTTLSARLPFRPPSPFRAPSPTALDLIVTAAALRSPLLLVQEAMLARSLTSPQPAQTERSPYTKPLRLSMTRFVHPVACARQHTLSPKPVRASLPGIPSPSPPVSLRQLWPAMPVVQRAQHPLSR